MNKQHRQILKAKLTDDDFSGLNNIDALAALHADSDVYAETLVNSRTLLNKLDSNEAGLILNALEYASTDIPAVKWAMVSIKADGIDVGNSATRKQLDDLQAGGVLTSENVNNMKALAPLIPVYQSIGVPKPTLGDVQKAREV